MEKLDIHVISFAVRYCNDIYSLLAYRDLSQFIEEDSDRADEMFRSIKVYAKNLRAHKDRIEEERRSFSSESLSYDVNEMLTSLNNLSSIADRIVSFIEETIDDFNTYDEDETNDTFEEYRESFLKEYEKLTTKVYSLLRLQLRSEINRAVDKLERAETRSVCCQG